jgi:hypothetical protein
MECKPWPYEFSRRSFTNPPRFRWPFCQLECLRRCIPASVRRVINLLPDGLDNTYEHALLSIDSEKREYVQRLFQCLTVSIRPLRVAELAEILAIRFDSDSIPNYNAGWRPGEAEEAVLSACSGLITVVKLDGSKCWKSGRGKTIAHCGSEG